MGSKDDILIICFRHLCSVTANQDDFRKIVFYISISGKSSVLNTSQKKKSCENKIVVIIMVTCMTFFYLHFIRNTDNKKLM